MKLLETIVARLDRIERRLGELAAPPPPGRRATPPGGVLTPAVAPRTIDGRPHVWGGEGTGWIEVRR